MNSLRKLDLGGRYDSSSLEGDSVYYSVEYGRFLVSLLSAESNYLIGGASEQPTALFPLLATDGPYGKVLNALPFFGSHGAPIVGANSSIRVLDLLRYVEEDIQKGMWDSVTVVENPLSPWSDDTLGELNFLSPIDERISQMTHWGDDPPESVEALLIRFHKKEQGAIRKGSATGQNVILGGSDKEWRFLIELHQRSISLLGGTPKSSEVFDLLRQHLGKFLRLHCGYLNNELVAALLTIRYGTTIEYFVPVVDPRYRSLQVLPHLISEVMFADFCDGARCWNWGGTWKSQTGVMQFKSRFGSTNRIYRYLNWSGSKMENVTSKAISESYRYWYVRKFV
jgi:hypothetical protein